MITMLNISKIRSKIDIPIEENVSIFWKIGQNWFFEDAGRLTFFGHSSELPQLEKLLK